MNRKMTCIVCPRGCEMDVEYDKNTFIGVKNNFCSKGEEYAKNEIISPKRVITSTVKVIDGDLLVLPVKTDKPVNKEKIFDIIKKIYQVKVIAPVMINDVLISNIDDNGANLVATSNTFSITK
ncbi:MAG: DUF1667 domain-containing protein [Clostridiales bacterium]|nr:DUF1667 domain-containing protein [Clostridiales bacterium]